MFNLLHRLFLSLSGHRSSLPESVYIFPEAELLKESEMESDEDKLLEPWDGPIEIPASRADVYEVFGNPGVGKVNPKWERSSMVVARNLPGIGKKYVHRLMEPYIREVCRRAEAAGIIDELSGQVGCWSFRHQRHDKNRPLSDHAFGIAIDVEPRDNRARRFPNRDAPEPFSEEWESLWPRAVSEKLVMIFEAVGFEWGGRWKGFPDPMHFSLRKR